MILLVPQILKRIEALDVVNDASNTLDDDPEKAIGITMWKSDFKIAERESGASLQFTHPALT